MANSFILYSGNGSTQNFTVPFGYFEEDHVTIEVSGAEVPSTWVSPTVIRATTAPAVGTANVKVVRSTPKERMVTFSDGSGLTADDLNTQALQAQYIAEEQEDAYLAGLLTALSVATSNLQNGSVTLAKIANITKTSATSARTLDSLLADTISVLDFGAVGDGYTDDAPAFQLAVDAVINRGGILDVPAGDYLFKSTVTIGVGSDITGGVLIRGPVNNSQGSRANLIQWDTNVPIFRNKSIATRMTGLSFTVFAGFTKNSAGANITVVSATVNTMTLSANPWEGRSTVIWAPTVAYVATDATSYPNVIRLNCFGAFVASGMTDNGNGTVTLTGVKGSDGTVNGSLAGTVGNPIESFISLAHRMNPASLDADGGMIFMDVRENCFFDHLWFNQCTRAFVFDALGSGSGVDTGNGPHWYSDIVFDQVIDAWYADANISGFYADRCLIYGAQRCALNVVGALTNSWLGGGVRAQLCTAVVKAASMTDVEFVGVNFGGLTGEGYANGAMTITGAVTDCLFNGCKFGRATLTVLSFGTVDGLTFVGNAITSHAEGGTDGFMLITGASFHRARVAGNEFAGKNTSSTNVIKFTNTSATLTGTFVDQEVTTNHATANNSRFQHAGRFGGAAIGAAAVRTASETNPGALAAWDATKHNILCGPADTTTANALVAAFDTTSGIAHLVALNPGAAWRILSHWAANFNWYTAGTLALAIDTQGNLAVKRIGRGLQVAEGANAKQGTATLVAGSSVVANTSITASSRIFLTAQSLGTVVAPKALAVTARVVGTSFTITSADATDTSVIAYEIFEPG